LRKLVHRVQLKPVTREPSARGRVFRGPNLCHGEGNIGLRTARRLEVQLGILYMVFLKLGHA
jgi:hypothetical protein